MISIFLKQIIIASIIGSILFVCILCMKQLLKKIIDITSSYRLWFLLILCLLIPFIPIKVPDFIDYNIPKITIAPSQNNIVNSVDTIEASHLNNDNAPVSTNNVQLRHKLNFNTKLYALIWLSGAIAYLIYMSVIN